MSGTIIIEETTENVACTENEDADEQFVEYVNFQYEDLQNPEEAIDDVTNASEVTDVQYLMEDDVISDLSNHVIVVHNGKQFLVTNDQINNNGEIILAAENCIENFTIPEEIIEYVIEEPENIKNEPTDQLIATVIDDTNNELIENYQLGESETREEGEVEEEEYAILKNGQLYIKNEAIEHLYPADVEYSIQDDSTFDQAFNNATHEGKFESNENEDIEEQLAAMAAYKNKKSRAKYTKLKKPQVKQKRLIGKILAIQRPGEEMAPVNKEFNITIPIREGKQGEDKTYDDDDAEMLSSRAAEGLPLEHMINTEPIDPLVSKTLCGLMDMDSFSKHLIDKTLLVKHLFKKVNSVTQQCWFKQVSYFKGTMVLTHSVTDSNDIQENWHFDQETDSTLNDIDTLTETRMRNDIDLNIGNVCDTQQISLAADEGDGLTIDQVVTQTTSGSDQKKSNIIVVHVIITESESGKKRTKVMIPTLNSDNVEQLCTICNKMFKNLQLFKRHIRNVHGQTSDDKGTVCDLCNKKFCDSFTLARHRRIHNGERNYQCTLCVKAFNTTGSLKRHITTHIPSLRPLQCMTCLQRFTDNSSLRKHVLLHTGIKSFQCDICYKRFVNQGDLNFHVKIHDSTKQYCCEICGKEFNRHSNLLRHLFIHRDNGNRDNGIYKCDLCGCTYNFMSSLTRHIVNYHMKE